MTHFSELFTSNTISILRSLDLSQPIENNAHIVPDIYVSWDDDKGAVEMTLKSAPGQIGSIWGKVSKNPQWLSLNLALGKTRFQPGDVLGLIFEIEGCEGHKFTPFIRSLEDGGEPADTIIEDLFEGSEDRAVYTLLHTITADQALAGPTSYHTLIVPLPRKEFRLDIRDIRLFVVPAARGLRSTPGTLSSLS